MRRTLFTDAQLAEFPALYTHENTTREQVPVVAKVFCPWGLGSWYLTEYSPEERTFFGLCCIQEVELGYVSLDELQGTFNIPVKVHELDAGLGPLGEVTGKGRWLAPLTARLHLERDFHWTGTLADAYETEDRERYGEHEAPTGAPAPDPAAGEQTSMWAE